MRRTTLIGGTTAAERNVISGNVAVGMFILGAAANGNAILGNSIFSNSFLGIDLDVSGVTANDALDADTGPNNLQNFPVLSCAVSANGSTTIQGTLNSLATTTFRLEFFANDACDASGNGEGQTYLGFQNITTDASGNATINFTVAQAVAAGKFVTATATRLDAMSIPVETSEFSACQTVVALTLSINDVTVTEGNAGTVNAVFTVTLAGAQGSCLPVTVNYANADGTATAGSDYVATSGQLTFAPGETTKTITVQVLGDLMTEPNETFTVNLSNAVNATLAAAVRPGGLRAALAGGQGIGTIVDDDNAPLGPGAAFGAQNAASDQKPGSVLFYNLVSSSATNAATQNARISLTNTHPSRTAYIHLFFVDGSTCGVADSFICLTPNQTATVLHSDIDPGVTGYVVAVATDRSGCPINFNYLIGDEYVKLTSGHAANLAAESIAARAGGATFCAPTASDAVLRFDDVSYDAVPRVLALDNFASPADGNQTLLVVNRVGGFLSTGAFTTGTLFGLLYDDAEQVLSFSLPGACQVRANVNGSTIRTVPRVEQFIPTGRTGWLKLYNNLSDVGLLGAALNFNANAATQPAAFNQGHNLHKLRLSQAAVYTIPIFPPSC
jgi:hypothetical protein